MSSSRPSRRFFAPLRTPLRSSKRGPLVSAPQSQATLRRYDDDDPGEVSLWVSLAGTADADSFTERRDETNPILT
jgi:hypothetical protein